MRNLLAIMMVYMVHRVIAGKKFLQFSSTTSNENAKLHTSLNGENALRKIPELLWNIFTNENYPET